MMTWTLKRLIDLQHATIGLLFRMALLIRQDPCPAFTRIAGLLSEQPDGFCAMLNPIFLALALAALPCSCPLGQFQHSKAARPYSLSKGADEGQKALLSYFLNNLRGPHALCACACFFFLDSWVPLKLTPLSLTPPWAAGWALSRILCP